MSSPQNREEMLLALALEKPTDLRPAFLDALCAGDTGLRKRLDLLLAARDAPGESPPTPAVRATIKLDLSEAPDEAVGQTLGRYKLLERVGEGGCGVVYVAEQTEPVRRRVALKVIKLGMDTKQVVARFEAERQALAMMDHPNIAKVLDAGTTETGRPYFVMELVRGIRITDYCDQANLTTKERLDLFIKVCQAIQHAHQKGIIHRDIKPSNILVTLHDGVPVPKVIDFGIAKATEGRLTDATVYTQLHQFIGTPAYMSPEQAEMSGLDIDTRSDIYSLGVLLYELLAGRTPFDAQELMSQGIDAMRKTIREKEPVRPSTRFATLQGEDLTTTAKRRSADKSKLIHQLKGDLDWIVMKCLEKDRTRRYDTANGLAADLNRHLNNEPVVARPASVAYKFQKAFRRNKLAFTAAAAVAVALVIGVSAVVVVQVRANRNLKAKNTELAVEQAKAIERFDLAAKAIQSLHTVISEEALLRNDEFKGLRTKLLGDAARFYAELEKLLAGQTDARSRKTLAAAYFQLGELTDKTGSKAEALTVHRKALAIRRDLAAVPGADAETRLDVARSLWKVGGLLSTTGDQVGAMATYTEQRDVAQRLEALDPAHGVSLELGHAHRSIAEELARTGKLTEAMHSCRRALAVYQKLADASPTNSDYQNFLVITYGGIGGLLAGQGQVTEALETFQKVRAISQRLAEANPTNPEYQDSLASCCDSISGIQSGMGKMPEAMELMRQSFDIRKRLADANPANNNYQRDLAGSCLNLGGWLWGTGKPEEGMETQQKGLAIYQKLADDNPTVSDFKSALAGGHVTVGQVLASRGKPEEAIEACHKGLAIYQRLAEANPDNLEYQSSLAATHGQIADTLSSMGKLGESLAEYRQALAIQKQLVAANPSVPYLASELARQNHNLGCNLLTSRPAKALEAFRESAAILKKLVDANPTIIQFRRVLAYSYLNIGFALTTMGKPAEALAEIPAGLAIAQKLADDNPTVSEFQYCLSLVQVSLGRAYYRTQRYPEALTVLNACVAIRQKLVETDPKNTDYRNNLAGGYAELGAARVRAGQPAEAARNLRRAVEEWAKVPPVNAWQGERSRAFALLAKLGGDAKSGVTAEEAKGFADQSVTFLADDIKFGWALPGELKEPDFDALRGRADFQTLFAEVEAKANVENNQP